MTIRAAVERADPRFVWLDVVAPAAQELSELVNDFGLRPLSVSDCLDPEHLPKYEAFEAHTFVILRAIDEAADRTADTVQALTRKIAVFYGATLLITVHRTEQPWLTTLTQRMVPGAGRAASLFRDVQENAESLHFYADELLDDVNTLPSVQLALGSHRTSEVMRVLTVFSVFFLPLTFIVCVYRMNFAFMPELGQRWGYPAVLGGMALVTLVIYRWFRARGWLR